MSASAGRRALAEALRHVGVRESPPGSNRTMFGRWFGVDGVPWCAIFVSYCFDVGAGRVLCRGWHGAVHGALGLDGRGRAGAVDRAVDGGGAGGQLRDSVQEARAPNRSRVVGPGVTVQRQIFWIVAIHLLWLSWLNRPVFLLGDVMTED